VENFTDFASFYVQEPLKSDDVEFPFADDILIPFDKILEGVHYDPYKIPAPFGCGDKLDQFG
jgi:hypothetical protein